MPGKYGLCDFLVRVTSQQVHWHRRPFRHTELFEDVQRRYDHDPAAAQALVQAYFQVVQGQDPDHFSPLASAPDCLPPTVFLQAVQCLALAEERRYSDFSRRGGGRWLPWRFGHGIAHGHFTAAQAEAVEKSGLQGIGKLEGERGMPPALAAHLQGVQRAGH